jgi:hypothetical protein
MFALAVVLSETDFTIENKILFLLRGPPLEPTFNI